MDFNISINARRGSQPGAQAASSHDFAALRRWAGSATGSVEAAQRVHSWVEQGDWSATLDLSHIDLRSCPPLPSEVQDLCLAFNPELDTLPHPLPSGLKTLNISFCNFTRLPHDWPAGLLELRLVTNKVAELPDTLPASLQILCATNNRLRSVPVRLPDALRELYLATNEIVELHPDLLALPHCTKLFLCNNPLSEASEAMLNERTAVPEYTGPAVKIGYVDDSMDLSRWIPETRAAQMWQSEGPPIVRPADAALRAMVNATLRANPGRAVASYADQYKTVIQAVDLRAGSGNNDAGRSNT